MAPSVARRPRCRESEHTTPIPTREPRRIRRRRNARESRDDDDGRLPSNATPSLSVGRSDGSCGWHRVASEVASEVACQTDLAAAGPTLRVRCAMPLIMDWSLSDASAASTTETT